MAVQMPPQNPLEGNQGELSINLHDGSEEQVSIVIVHKDRPEYLNICLQSIAVTSFNNNYEIIVVDNASGADSQEYLDEIEGEVKVVRNKENLFWGPAINRGVEAADKNSKYLIFMHCDVVILNPAWIDLMINVSEAHNAGVVGLELQSYYLQQQKVDFIQEWCVLVTRECWDDCGPFPPEVPQIGGPFMFTMRAQQKSYRPQVMKNNVCHHYRIFSLNINEFEMHVERSLTMLPQLLRKMQGEPVNP
jgi:glycosyltransferase involved in cell wall biosynthesis